MKILAGAALGALLCLLSIGAQAQSTEIRRFYLGIDAGQAKLHRSRAALAMTGPRETAATGWKLRFGYRFSPYFSLETAVTDFGACDGTSQVVLFAGSPHAAPAPGDHRTSAKGMEVSAIGSWPLGQRFYVSATAGILRRETRTVFESRTAGRPGFRGKDGDLATQLGTAFGFVVDETLDVVASWTRSRHLSGDTEFIENESDPSLVSVGLRLRF
jgi:hypothetical protein